jgi:uncharacterized protein YheU (UPF0270 family)
MPTNRDRSNENEPRSETLRGRSFEGTSYGATEREQSEDLRRRIPQDEAVIEDDEVSEDLEIDIDERAD